MAASPDKIYYMRIALGVIGGIIAGLVIAPEFDQGTSVGIAFAIAAVLFGISVAVAKKMARGLPREVQKKAGYDGIVPFIFMNIVFMVIVYTALHQGTVLK
ncbi:hypothetical protein [Nitrososphaera sp.]|uniref:hypothetical protein n=1 Tax=Nitrososphaera sp. TaxID=1971748 RepID=UPI00307D7BE7